MTLARQALDAIAAMDAAKAKAAETHTECPTYYAILGAGVRAEGEAADACIALVRSPEFAGLLQDKARLDWLERQVHPETREYDGSMALLLKFRFNHLWNEEFREAIDQRIAAIDAASRQEPAP